MEAAAVIAPQGNTQMTIGDRSASAALCSPQGGLEQGVPNRGLVSTGQLHCAIGPCCPGKRVDSMGHVLGFTPDLDRVVQPGDSPTGHAALYTIYNQTAPIRNL